MKDINVVFISSIAVGKSTLIERMWVNYIDDKDTNNSGHYFNVSEEIQGRGEIKYTVNELPFFSSSLKCDYQKWINSEFVYNSLISADVIVLVISADDKLIKEKILFYKQIQETLLRGSAKLIVAINQIDAIVDINAINDNYFISIESCQQLIEKRDNVVSTFKANGISCKNDSVVLTCAPINWNCKVLKDIIVDMVIDCTNNYMYNPSLQTIAFIGKTGSGKSSTINLLCNTNLPVDVAEACTKFPIVITGKHNGKEFNIIDLPGISECIGANIDYTPFYSKYLGIANTIVYLTQADTRAYKQDQLFVEMLIETNVINNKKNIVLGINKIDLLFKDKDHLNGIDLKQVNENHFLIREKIDDYFDNIFADVYKSISCISKESIVPYSVYQKWNIEKLWSHIAIN